MTQQLLTPVSMRRQITALIRRRITFFGFGTLPPPLGSRVPRWHLGLQPSIEHRT